MDDNSTYRMAVQCFRHSLRALVQAGASPRVVYGLVARGAVPAIFLLVPGKFPVPWADLLMNLPRLEIGPNPGVAGNNPQFDRPGLPEVLNYVLRHPSSTSPHDRGALVTIRSLDGRPLRQYVYRTYIRTNAGDRETKC
jgi:hypothetical protein